MRLSCQFWITVIGAFGCATGLFIYLGIRESNLPWILMGFLLAGVEVNLIWTRVRRFLKERNIIR